MLEFYILGNRNSEQSLFHLKLSLTAGFEFVNPNVWNVQFSVTVLHFSVQNDMLHELSYAESL